MRDEKRKGTRKILKKARKGVTRERGKWNEREVMK